MHGHEFTELTEIAATYGLVGVPFIFGFVLFMAGVLPVPVGYERGKIKWVMWCGTGMHAHIVYYWGNGRGFQTLHPADKGGDSSDA